MAKSKRDNNEMLKGTLDMMVLRTLMTGDAHGHTIAKVIEADFRKMCWKSSRGRSIRRCTGWRDEAGFRPTGARARTTARQSSTA